MGGDVVMADLGRADADKCEKAGAPTFSQNRVPPEFFLPSASTADEETSDNAQHEKTKLQPDIMLVHQRPCKEDTVIHIVEYVDLKYCRDTDPKAQLEHCTTQHACLIRRLTMSGYKESNIKLVPILLGTSGTVYSEHTMENLKKLGISSYHATKCARKMHIHAIKLLHSIVCVRRRLENTIAPVAGVPQPSWTLTKKRAAGMLRPARTLTKKPIQKRKIT
jgi:hypothetical protein